MKGLSLRTAIAPIYLVMCLLFGGSAQGIWTNAFLQIVAVGIIGFAILDLRGDRVPLAARHLLMLMAATVAWAIVQLIPLPPGIWSALPGRSAIVEGRHLLGLQTGWAPISLAPYQSIATMLPLLPPIALFLAIIRWGRKSGRTLAIALVATAMVGLVLGLLQVSSPDPHHSPWYLYRYSNFEFATGFFANSNHMATLLVTAVGFLGAIVAEIGGRSKMSRRRITALISGALCYLFIALGLFFAGSLAGAGLFVAATMATAVTTLRLRAQWRRVVGGVGLAAVAAFLLFQFTVLGQWVPAGASTSVSSRAEIVRQSLAVLKDYGLVGSGLGTFPNIYAQYEDPQAVAEIFVNHVHFDYIEVAIELGVVGAVLIFLLFLWWCRAVKQLWVAPDTDRFALAGVIGSAIILLHSAVDFPLRTSAIAAVFATCLALMLVSRRTGARDTDIRETRHLVIE